MIFVLIAILLVQSSAFAEEVSPVRRGAISAEALQIAREEDTLHGLDRIGSNDGDHVTALGTVIAANCFTGPRAHLRRATLQKIALSLDYAVRQVRRCDGLIGTTMVAPVIPVLMRTRITCKDLGNAYGANTLFSTGGDWTRLRNSWADHRAEFALSAFTAGTSPLDRLDIPTLASTLVHEMSHSLPMNNSPWHTPRGIGDQSWYGCSHSIFRDRIYMLQAFWFGMLPKLLLSGTRAPVPIQGVHPFCVLVFVKPT